MKNILLLSFLLLFSFSVRADFVIGKKYFDEGKYSEALAVFSTDANAGDKRAQYYAGYLYLNGFGVKKDAQKAVKYLTDSANQNYANAQSQLGYLYDKGEVVPVNKKKAIELYKAASDQNDTSAMLNLGLAYYTGNGVTRDVSKAIELLKKVPDDNRPYIGRYLGDLYMNSSEPDKLQKAKKEYIRSARLNDMDAYYALGGIYEDTEDIDRALECYSYAASNNHVLSQYVMGIMYLDGVGVKKDLIKAHAWLEIAANREDSVAREELNKLDKKMGLSQKEAARVEFNRIQRDVIGKLEPPSTSIDDRPPSSPIVHKLPIHRRRR